MTASASKPVADPATAGGTRARPRRDPYVGLRPFGPQDVGWFFGRAREQRLISANLRSARLTLLYGASGVGKSSVVMAAVVPELRKVVAADRAAAQAAPAALHEPVRFAVAVFSSWRDAPLENLMKAVAESVEEATGETVKPWVHGAPLRATFAEWLGPVDGSPGEQDVAGVNVRVGSLLIVLDQFEEYFLYHPRDDGPGTFAGEFVDVVNDPRLSVNFLLCLREDGLAKLDRFKGRVPRLFDNYLRVRHLDFEAATQAIEGPLEAYNALAPDAEPATIDPELVEQILEKIGTTGDALDAPAPDRQLVETPLLQLVMRRLWSEAVREAGGGPPRMTAATLTALGGTEDIVERHLAEAIDAVQPPNPGATAAVLRQLISPSGTKIAGRATGLASGKHPVQEIEPILELLASGEQRILRRIEPPADAPDPTPLYELFHDILAQPVLEWCNVREGEEQERERRRERRNRVVQRFALGLAALSVCLIVAVVVAVNARQIAGSRALAASAMSQLAVEPERGLLLATAAMDRRGTAEARQALRRSLTASRVRARLQDGRARACLACDGLVTRPSGRVATVARPLALAPDGRTVAGIVGSRLQLWSPQTGSVRPSPVDVGDPIGVAFTPDAKRLLVLGSERAALMAPDGTGVVVLARGRNRGEYTAGAASADGRFVAAVDEKGVSVWDARSGEAVTSLPGSYENSVAFAGEGRLAVRANDGWLQWRWSTGEKRHLGPPVEEVPVFDTQYSAEAGFEVESVRGTHQARVVPADGRPVVLPPGTPERPVENAAISPDGERVALVIGAKVELWRPGRPGWHGRPHRIASLLHGDGLYDVVFSADGTLVATASSDGSARVWESATGDLVAELRGHTAGVTGLAFSADGRFLVSVGEDRAILLWDLGRQRTLRGAESVAAVVTAGTGTRVVVVEDHGRLELWDTHGPRPTPIDPLARAPRARDAATLGGDEDGCRGTGGRLHPTSAALAADDRALLVGYGSPDSTCGHALLLDLDSRRVLFEPEPESQAVLKVAVDRRARSVAIVRAQSRSAYARAELFDVPSGRPHQLRSEGRVTDVAFSPDGTRLLTTDVDGGAFVYDVASRRRLLTLVPGTAQDPRAEAFYRGVFSPDGRTVAVAGSRGVRFWDSVTGRPRKTVLSGHTSVLRSVAYRRDGQQILTAGADGTVRVWDARTGSPLAVLARHGGPVNDAAFLPDGSIVSGGADHAVRVYRCETCGPADTLLGLAAKQVTRRLSAQERTQFGQ